MTPAQLGVHALALPLTAPCSGTKLVPNATQGLHAHAQMDGETTASSSAPSHIPITAASRCMRLAVLGHPRCRPLLSPSIPLSGPVRARSCAHQPTFIRRPQPPSITLLAPPRRTLSSRSTSTSPPPLMMDLPEGLHPKHPLKVLVLGAGNFGSCLADHLADVDHIVYIWSREAEVVEGLNKTHRNPKYLTDHAFPEDIIAVGPDFPDAEVMNSVDVLLFAIPTQGLRETLEKVNARLNPDKLPLFIFVNKGIEVETQALPLEIIADTCGVDIARVATFVSGPSFAKEIVKRQPTTVSVASLSPECAQRTSDLFHQPWFRCYTNPDPVGVELAGALKNVYAIASGIAEGMGYANNTRAGLITRSLAEMTRVGTAYGASPLTFLSLAGVGDLFLTCSSTTSRNFTVGHRLGKGEELQHIIDTLGSVAEGVTTAKALHTILAKLEVKAPIAEGVYAVLYEGRGAHEMAGELMSLPPQSEIDLPSHISKPVRALMKKLGIKEGDLSPRTSVLSPIGPD